MLRKRKATGSKVKRGCKRESPALEEGSLETRGGLVSTRASKGASSAMEGPSGADVLGNILLKYKGISEKHFQESEAKTHHD